jgi:hypothetical protein
MKICASPQMPRSRKSEETIRRAQSSGALNVAGPVTAEWNRVFLHGYTGEYMPTDQGQQTLGCVKNRHHALCREVFN